MQNLSAEEIRSILRAACVSAGSQAAFADANGLSRAYVSDTLNGRREPSEAILKALGYRRVTLYERAA